VTDDREMISIPVSYYEELLADAKELARLEACGVDNWEGYGMDPDEEGFW